MPRRKVAKKVKANFSVLSTTALEDKEAKAKLILDELDRKAEAKIKSLERIMKNDEEAILWEMSQREKNMSKNHLEMNIYDYCKMLEEEQSKVMSEESSDSPMSSVQPPSKGKENQGPLATGRPQTKAVDRVKNTPFCVTSIKPPGFTPRVDPTEPLRLMKPGEQVYSASGSPLNLNWYLSKLETTKETEKTMTKRPRK